MDPPPLAVHVSTWFCPALNVPLLLTILTVRGRIVVVVADVVIVVGLVDGNVAPVVGSTTDTLAICRSESKTK